MVTCRFNVFLLGGCEVYSKLLKLRISTNAKLKNLIV
jgi:hypothetical protein